MPSTNWEFHPKYVQPFYLKIGYSLLNKEHDEQAQMVADIRAVIDDLDHDTVINLFRRGRWRARNSMGFILGYANWNQYIPLIGESMLRHPDYGSMFCFALARFGKEESILWLTKYLDQYMIDEVANDFNADRYMIHSALAALQILDNIHDTHFAESYYPKKFNIFRSTFLKLFENFSNNKLPPPWNVEAEQIDMKKLIDFSEQHFD